MKRKHLLGLACAVAGGLAAAAVHRSRRHAKQPHLDAARAFNRHAGLLALSVLADSAAEHYRGSFTNPAMALPLLSSICSLGAGIHGGGDPRAKRHPVRHAMHWSAIAVSLAGAGFHCYNIGKRPGGWCWNNLFYAAPLGAPVALLLSGLLGDTAERLREQPAREPRLFGLRAWRAMALLSAAGLLGSSAEAGLLHFRGSFQHRAMYAPVVLPPAAAILLIRSALSSSDRMHRPVRWTLRLTALLGVAGTLFHIRGIARYRGGWRNWRQNYFAGPPVPAPPSFTALALAGEAALALREAES